MTALALLRRFWWAIPIIGLAAALLITRETLADRTATLSAERQAWSAEIDRAERQRAEIEKRNADRLVQATGTYADRLAAREPIILRSTNTVREYATTDAGRLRCRGADRVRAIDALDAELADPAPSAGSGAGAVRGDAPAPAG
ncbi:hypothetical protein [Sphingomonas sp.]|uniref:hypothetical protein n=1 Tax=Sphingomonas sp. TaxID=28214 RepID=UPI0035B21C26